MPIQVKATPEDSKATYEILGSDDLKKNQYQVKVVVTSPMGTKNTYVILVKKKPNSNEVSNSDPVSENSKPEEKEKKESPIPFYIGIVAIGIILLVVIAFIVEKIKNRKMNKMLDDL